MGGDDNIESEACEEGPKVLTVEKEACRALTMRSRLDFDRGGFDCGRFGCGPFSSG
jgi:hypothetical protein